MGQSNGGNLKQSFKGRGMLTKIMHIALALPFAWQHPMPDPSMGGAPQWN